MVPLSPDWTAQANVLSFIDMAAHNRGWRLRTFPEVEPALE